jgi:aryl-alcohol dehydrogenase-like predicted oxidoreductase
MRTVALAGTGLFSSRLGFGLSGLHHLFRSKERQLLLSSAFQNGINYFDTAPYYGHGLAERELGRFAAARRNQILIATKVGILADPWFKRMPVLMYSRLATNAVLRRITRRKSFVVARRYDYGCRSAAASLDQSLRDLRTDHVDILYLHDPTLARLTEPHLLFETLRGLQTAGKVRYFGLAGNGRECTAILDNHPGLRCLLQVDASPGIEELEALNAASIPFHGSYGHFRTRRDSVPTALAGAIRANRQGVILFSSRSASRIDSMVRLLTSLDTS